MKEKDSEKILTGPQIKKMINDSGISRPKLAIECGFGKSNITYMERHGINNIFLKMCDYLNKLKLNKATQKLKENGLKSGEVVKHITNYKIYSDVGKAIIVYDSYTDKFTIEYNGKESQEDLDKAKKLTKALNS